MDRLIRSSNAASDPLALAQNALSELRSDPELSRAIDAADDRFPIRPLRLAAGAGIAFAASPILLPALLAIRLKELTDEQTSQVTMPDKARDLLAREDLQVQNQLTHVVPLRTGWLRSLSVNVVLTAIDFLAHTIFTRGNLGGITSIHFARWVRIDDGTRVCVQRAAWFQAAQPSPKLTADETRRPYA